VVERPADMRPSLVKRLVLRIMQYAFCIAVLASVLPLGSVEQSLSSSVLIFVSILLIASVLLNGIHLDVRRMFDASIGIVLILGGWAFLQTIPIYPSWVHPYWAELAMFAIPPERASISVDPDATLRAIPALAMPFLVFLTALALFAGKADGMKLLRFLGYFGAAVAVLAIVEHLFSPGTVLLIEKRAHQESLTTPFLNRNTAATFFGTVALIMVVLCQRELQRKSLWSQIMAWIMPGVRRTQHNARLAVHLVLLLVVVVALALTRSRAGLAASLAGFGLVVIMALPTPASWFSTGNFVSRAAKNCGAMMVALLVLYLMAGRTLFRTSVEGVTDPARTCIYKATLTMISDNWPLGAGLNSFASAYPSFRQPDCTNIWFAVDRAHSVFLEAIAGLGWVAVVIIPVIYIILLGCLLKGTKTRDKLKIVPIVGLAIVTLVTLHSSIDYSLQIPGYAAFFAASIGAIICICCDQASGIAKIDGKKSVK
jgi:O-Antigen ligase